MLVDVAAGAEPVFARPNYFNRFATEQAAIAITGGDSAAALELAHRAHDGVRSTQAQSVGSSAGGSWTYSAGLYEGSAQVTKAVDLIGLLNINLRRFRLRLSQNNGSGWSDPAGLDFTGSDNAKRDLWVSLASPIDTNRFIIEATEVMAGEADAEKRVGQVILTQSLLQPSVGFAWPDGYEEQPDERGLAVVQLLGGAQDYTVFARADDEHEYAGDALVFRGVDEDDVDGFNSLRKSIEPFLFVPEPGDDPGKAYLTRMVSGSFRKRRLTPRHQADPRFLVSFETSDMGVE